MSNCVLVQIMRFYLVGNVPSGVRTPTVKLYFFGPDHSKDMPRTIWFQPESNVGEGVGHFQPNFEFSLGPLYLTHFVGEVPQFDLTSDLN